MQSPVATMIGAVGFGLGVAMLVIGLLLFSVDAWMLFAVGSVAAIGGGWVLAIPMVQANRVVRERAEDGIVVLRLLVTQHGLVVFGRGEPSVTAWVAIDRVQIHDRHVGLISGRRFVIPPLRLDDDQGPFAARILANANGRG